MKYWRVTAVAVAVSLLAACGDKDASSTEAQNPGPVTPVAITPGTTPETTPETGLGVDASPGISGSPATSISAGSSYAFTPSASDPDGDTLAFSISNKPAWASFITATGSLEGTAQSGTYADITISVSDGTTTRSLPAFTLAVVEPDSGTMALSWSAPTNNVDGSPLTDLAGYRVYHGTSPTALNEVIQLSGADSTAYTFNHLAAGTHYFAVAAYTSLGTESETSGVGSKTIL